LRNEAYAGSEQRAYLLKNVNKLDLPAKSLVLAQTPRWLPPDQARDLLFGFAKDAHPGIRETVFDALCECGTDPSLMEDFAHDPDLYISQKAKKFLGSAEVNKIPELPEDKVRGILFGAAIGDAVGAQVEFLSREEILKIYGQEVDGYVNLEQHRQKLLIRPGEVTDVAAMGLMNLDAFLEQGFYDPSLVGRKYGQEIERIDRAQMPNIGYAARTSMDMRKLGLGCNWRLSGHGGTGCGAAMRVFALPLFTQGEASLRQTAFDSAQITHDSDLGRASAYVVARAIAYLLQTTEKLSPEEFLQAITAPIRDLSPELAEKILKVREYLDLPASDGLAKIGTNSDAIETVPAAFYAFLKSPENFTATLRHAINVDGDSDSIASIACALSGAYNGSRAIPPALTAGLKPGGEIDERVGRLRKLRLAAT